MGPEYSEGKRKLLEKYLQHDWGSRAQTQQIPRRQPGERIPLSHAQEQIWIHAQLAPEVPLYNEAVTIHYSGSLNVEALERAFNEILRRHEAWRTSFAVVDGQPVQQVSDNLSISLPVVDLRRIPQEQRDTAAVTIATTDARVPLDLGQVPLFRVRLVRLDDEQYRLYLTLSHIIFDGVAIYRVFLPELSTLYKAYAAGQPSPLPELPIQYPDYACWERRTLTREVLSKDVEYWREKLSGTLPENYLLTDRPQKRGQTFDGSMYPFKLSSSLTSALREFCRSERVSLFTVLLAGFAALLHRYSGEDRIPIGSVTAGRNRPETQALLGYFLNTVVLATDMSGDPDFRTLVSRARNLTLEALDHDRVPLEYLARELRVQRDPGRGPFFQVMFSLEPPMPQVDPSWRLTQMDVDTGATKYDLYLEMDDRTEEVLARFHYTNLFDAETIVRMSNHWQKLLEEAVVNPEQRIANLSMLSSEEREKILVEWNDTAQPYPQTSIHEIFEQQVERSPEDVAILAGETKLTYSGLNQRANQVARYLQSRGVAPGSLVGIFLERSPDMVAALLGVLKAGAAYVPLDPADPLERLRFTMQDASLASVVTHSAIQERLPGGSQNILVLDGGDVRDQPTTNLTRAVSSEQLAYVIYTSGSTGAPKGVQGTHRASINRFTWMWRTYPFQAGEVCCQKTNLGFVDSIWEIFGPLLAGVPNVIIPREAVRDPEEMLQILARERVSRIVLVPSLLRSLLDHAPNLAERVPALRLWSCSGEVLPVDLAKRFREAYPEARLLNIYGSSEVAADVTCHEVSDRDTASSVLIGKPISNTQIYLVDEYSNPVPVGVRGEIYVGGDGLARGYLNRPDLTADRFVPNWLQPIPSSSHSTRLYRTGDLGRFRSNGEIEYLGRIDSQVKLRGLRVELGEIESVLASHPAVREAAVTVSGEGEQQKLVAYLAVNEGTATPTAGELRRTLRSKLPEHMVPASYWQLDRLPRLPSGKVQSDGLSTSKARSLREDAELIVPRNDVEAKLAEIWRELLQVDRVGIEQNFFELGGHSLLVLQVTARIRRLFQLELPVRCVFEAPTIAGLAIEVEKARALGLKARTPIAQRRQRAPEPDLSHESLLSELEKLPPEEARNLLNKLLDGKQNYEFLP